MRKPLPLKYYTPAGRAYTMMKDDVSYSFNEVADLLDISPQSVSIHLRTLCEEGLVEMTKVMTKGRPRNMFKVIPITRQQAPHGWVYIGPDGEWHHSPTPDLHEGVTELRPATAMEAELIAMARVYAD